MISEQPILQVSNAKIHFPIKRSVVQTLTGAPKKKVHAIDGVSFDVERGKILAIVGESGCGKTTLGRAFVHLNKLTEGDILYNGTSIREDSAWQDNSLRKEIQYIFQDPYASLNPKMTVLEAVREPMDVFDLYDKGERDDRAVELLQSTGISSYLANRYPHEFSGGQRQRICVARALAVEPKVIIADEPTSALDVSVQCTILDLLLKFQRELDLTYLFISHDLGVVNYISDDVLVMYLGHIVEKGNTHEVFAAPAHPYTQALVDALPKRGSSSHDARVKLQGYIPSPIDPPKGCLLHPRCPYAQEICKCTKPEMRTVAPGREVACHFPLLQAEE